MLGLAAPAQGAHNPAGRRLAIQLGALPAHTSLIVANRQVEHLEHASKHGWQVGFPVYAASVLLRQSSQQT